MHPNFKNVSPNTVGQAMLAAIRLGQTKAIDLLIKHPNFKQLSLLMVHQIIKATLAYQDYDFVTRLMRFPDFKEALQKHLEEMIYCALRTSNREWLENLFKHEDYFQIESRVFPDIMRWALRRRDKKIIRLVLRRHSFNEKTEAILINEIFNAFLIPETKRKLEIEAYVVQQLVKNPDYKNFSPLMIAWLTEKAILLGDDFLFFRLRSHPNFAEIPSNVLADLLTSATSLRRYEMQKALAAHPHFKGISGDKLGLILEAGIRYDDPAMAEMVMHHPSFQEIPDDAFERIAVLELHHPDNRLKERFLVEPAFQPKYARIIFEVIRRNDSELIAQFLRESLLKKLFIDQLIKYASAEEKYVSGYIIRDVLREAFLTDDRPMIAQLVEMPLFVPRIVELMHEATQYDDDELIVHMLLNLED
jgi:hypothetical protein